MSTILVTGASGFIGKALAAALAERHQVLTLSRHDPRVPKATIVRGDFSSAEDLRQLDRHRIDAAVHLAAVTGGCSERDGILVNVEGTRTLVHYLAERGCRKFVLASSIAVVGMQNTKFRPLQVPMSDEHPCLDRDGYGLSKYLMEELLRYLVRQTPELDVIAIRLASIAPDTATPGGLFDLRQWALGSLTQMLLSDAVRLFSLAAEAPRQPGLRIMNGTCAKAFCTVPTAPMLRHWWGNDVDLSAFERPGHEYDSAYDASRVAKELGFTATATLRALEGKQK